VDPEPRWYFQLFGGFEAHCGTVCVHRLRTAKTTALMGYLVAHPPHRFPREALCERFWDDREPERARNSLSVALNAIRHAFHLGEASAPLLECDAHTVALNSNRFTADVLAFEEAIALAQRTSDSSAQRHHYAHAASLYHGEFMAGLLRAVDYRQVCATPAAVCPRAAPAGGVRPAARGARVRHRVAPAASERAAV
jgi:DNA-binding SARP family transcriptional activator